MTELDKKIQEIALLNWPQFVQLIGDDAIIKAKTCLLRQQGRSYGEICVKLDLSKDQVVYACKKC
jgi:exopolysaccharide biosynthesis predicted pyruvyltransferase EpsI